MSTSGNKITQFVYFYPPDDDNSEPIFTSSMDDYEIIVRGGLTIPELRELYIAHADEIETAEDFRAFLDTRFCGIYSCWEMFVGEEWLHLLSNPDANEDIIEQYANGDGSYDLDKLGLLLSERYHSICLPTGRQAIIFTD